MVEIKVANLRDTKDGIRCDRQTPLGNPFIMIAHAGKREEVVADYRLYLNHVANLGMHPIESVRNIKAMRAERRAMVIGTTPTRDAFLAELARIAFHLDRDKKATLLCWCAPEACHCDALADYFSWLICSGSSDFEDLVNRYKQIHAL